MRPHYFRDNGVQQFEKFYAILVRTEQGQVYFLNMQRMKSPISLISPSDSDAIRCRRSRRVYAHNETCSALVKSMPQQSLDCLLHPQ